MKRSRHGVLGKQSRVGRAWSKTAHGAGRHGRVRSDGKPKLRLEKTVSKSVSSEGGDSFVQITFSSHAPEFGMVNLALPSLSVRRTSNGEASSLRLVSLTSAPASGRPTRSRESARSQTSGGRRGWLQARFRGPDQLAWRCCSAGPRSMGRLARWISRIGCSVRNRPRPSGAVALVAPAPASAPRL
jgi:hypothetical protein